MLCFKLIVFITCLRTSTSLPFGPLKSIVSCESDSKSVRIMSPLKQFSFTYVNAGRRKHTHKRLTDIDQVLTKFTPHGLFVAELLLDDRTRDALISGGFNIEQLIYKTKEKRIWACVRNDTPYKRRADLEKRQVAAIWLQFRNGRNSFLVVGYYREHRIIGDPDYRADVTRQRIRFNQFLDVVREVTLKERKEVHLIGDFNLNILNWKQNGNDSPWHLQTLVDDLHEKVLNGAGYVQTVTELTRWSKKVNSILDLHFTNRPDRTRSVKLTRNFRTDHAVMTLT